jgi:hypothetical protein
MKKTYFAPEMEIIEVKAQQTLLAGSVAKGGDYDGEGVCAPEYEWADWEF